jgi:hypothetical protein
VIWDRDLLVSLASKNLLANLFTADIPGNGDDPRLGLQIRCGMMMRM